MMGSGKMAESGSFLPHTPDTQWEGAKNLVCEVPPTSSKDLSISNLVFLKIGERKGKNFDI